MTTKDRNAAYYAANKAKVIATTRARKLADPVRKRAEDRAWARRNPHYNKIRKMRRRDRGEGIVSPRIVALLWAAQNGTCPVCLVDLNEAGFHVDHVMPLALDGKSEDNNLQLLCPPCNRAKGAKHPLDFLRSRGLF